MKRVNARQDSINNYVHAGNIRRDSALSNFSYQIASLTAIIDSCCSLHHAIPMQNNNGSGNNQAPQDSKGSSMVVTLNNKNIVILNQNSPNPFAEQTTITYYLPSTVSKAMMLFYDESGKMIKSAEINDRGAGSMIVYANDLTSGVYSYTFVVDGQIFDTKKMMKN